MGPSFSIDAKLGRGPAGATYSARLADGSPVVAKVLIGRFREHPELLRQVQEDLRPWIGFKHKNVVATLGIETYQDRDVILFEAARGQSCDTLLQQHGPFEVRLAMRVTRDVAMALAIAHDRGLQVGDIRPAKVYFDPTHGAQIADLGLHRASCLTSGFGRFGLQFGHPAYLAPEAVQEGLQVPTPATDIYALGILFYELVTGKPPFQGDAPQLLQWHLETPLPLPTVSGITPLMAKWLLRMTAKSPRRRIPNGMAAVNAIYKLIGQPPPFPEPVAKKAMTTTTWRRTAAEPEFAAGSDDWSEERVDAAPKVGPSLPSSVSGRLMPQDLKPLQKKTEEKKKEPEGPAEVQLGKQIGRGPVGSTYEGILKGHDGQVVIKVITRRFAKHPELLEKILANLRQVIAIRDDRLLSLYHVLNVSGRDVAVFERAAGPNLRQVLRNRTPQGVAKSLNWAKNIGTALLAVRKFGMSHGDIRPEKVYLDAKGVHCRLADLGLANASCLASNWGKLGMHFGHPAYLAPEIVQETRESPDVRADMYSVGILLYELISGSPPFQAEDEKQLLLMHLKQTPPPPRNVSVPTPLAELILRLTAKSPVRRPQSIEELIDAIERCQKQVLLATGLTKNVAVAEFDPTDSGEDIQAAGTAGWEKEAVRQAETTGSWSRDKIIGLGQVGPDLYNLMASEEISPSHNPFAGGDK